MNEMELRQLEAQLVVKQRELESYETELKQREQEIDTERIAEIMAGLKQREEDLKAKHREYDLKLDALERGSEPQQSRLNSTIDNEVMSTLSRMQEEMQAIRQELKNETPNPSISSNSLIGQISIKDALAYVPIFNGKNMTVAQFLRTCQRALKLLPRGMEKTFLELMRQKFTDQARIAVENSEYNTFAELEQLLRSIFDPQRTASQYKAELENISIKSGEPIINYINRVQVLHGEILHAESSERAFLSRETKLKIENDTIEAFLNGLPPLKRIECQLKPHDTLEQTYQAATLVYRLSTRDKIIFPEKTAKISIIQNTNNDNNKSSNVISNNNNNITNTNRSNPNSNIVTTNANNNASNDSNAYRNLKCNYCQRIGHTESRCYGKERDQRYSNRTNQNDNRYNANNNYSSFNRYRGNAGCPVNGSSQTYCEFHKTNSHDITACQEFENLYRIKQRKSNPGNEQGARGKPTEPRVNVIIPSAPVEPEVQLRPNGS